MAYSKESARQNKALEDILASLSLNTFFFNAFKTTLICFELLNPTDKYKGNLRR